MDVGGRATHEPVAEESEVAAIERRFTCM